MPQAINIAIARGVSPQPTAADLPPAPDLASTLASLLELEKEYRARIVARDGGRCAVCGSTTMLQVHHVDLDRTHSDPCNLLTLCAACHLGYHGRGEQTDEIASAHAAMLYREFGSDQQGAPC